MAIQRFQLNSCLTKRCTVEVYLLVDDRDNRQYIETSIISCVEELCGMFFSITFKARVNRGEDKILGRYLNIN